MKKLAEVLKDWEAVIGLEVHTELTTLETKMFCNCRLSHDDPPNTNVCPVCLGMPGALPVPNEKAIESIVMAGLANQLRDHAPLHVLRKHYFYPDMAKNFQTTQGPVAFCMHGHLDLEVSGAGAKERRTARSRRTRTAATSRPSGSCASTWRRTPPRWCTWVARRAASPRRPSPSSTTTAAARR